MKKFFNGRKGLAFVLLIASAGLTLIFGAGLSLHFRGRAILSRNGL